MYIGTTTNTWGTWNCNCYHYCNCNRRWCGQCCRYVSEYHYHAPYIPPQPIIVHPIVWPERPRRKKDKRHRPYVDIRPALPRGCR